MSMFSTTSENSLPSAPVVWIAMASTPTIGPSPKAITKIRANTTSGTVRHTSSRRLAPIRSPRDRTRLAAATKLRAKPA
ncbi:hypothetical protein, partial [Enterobacter hormaechei]|uniref:hypothetical protein n=1 Tax=Enterobacter hormaechei TaxID=158836 RepID=UPI002876DFB4